MISLFSSTFFTVFATIICPYLIDCYNSKINLIVTIWMALVFFNAFCSKYSKNNQQNLKWTVAAIDEFIKIQRDTANKIFKGRKNLAKIVEHISKNGETSAELAPYYFNYEHATELACQSIYNIIKNITSYEDHQVTVYRRFQDKSGKSCPQSCPLINDCKKKKKVEWTKMIACYNKQGSSSLSFDQEHCFEYCDNRQTDSGTVELKQHFYIHFFKNNITDIEILTGKKQIAKKFLFHESTKTREENIEQYIGIPMYCAENKTDNMCADVSCEIRNQQHLTYAVVQIDFFDKGILGRNDNRIKDFISNILGGVVSYLDSSLQVDGMNNQFFDCITDLASSNIDSYNQLQKEYDSLEKKYNDIINDYNALIKGKNTLFHEYKGGVDAKLEVSQESDNNGIVSV